MPAIWNSWRRNADLRTDPPLRINRFAKLFLGYPIRIVSADNPSGAHHQDAVALMQDFIRLVRDEKNCQTARGERVDDLKNPGFGADIHSHRRGIQNKNARIGGEPRSSG